jgi:hypothetical protein
MKSVWIFVNEHLNCLILSVRVLMSGGILLNAFIQHSRSLSDIIINFIEVGENEILFSVVEIHLGFPFA